MDGKTNQIFDKVLKRILTLSQKAVVGFINGLFNENFPLNSEIGYNETENINDNLEKTIADVILTVKTVEKAAKFHIEAQINNDSEMVVRVFEYGLAEASRYKEITPDRIRLFFPEPKIIYLEHNEKTPSEVVLELNFGKQGSCEYKVPTMKFLAYSVEELNSKNMVILLPLYLLKLRKEICKNPTKENAELLRKLLDEDIIGSIERSRAANEITSEDTRVLIGLLDKLYEYLYGDVELLKEERVKEMLADRMVLEFEEVREQTEEKTTLFLVHNMLREGDAIEKISRVTAFPIERIKKLQEEINEN